MPPSSPLRAALSGNLVPVDSALRLDAADVFRKLLGGHVLGRVAGARLCRHVVIPALVGYEVDMNEDLQNIAKAMEIKDYTKVADILLYTVKPDFEKLDIDL